MSILAKMDAAMTAKDEAAMNEIFHNNYKFTDATAAEQHYQNCDSTKCKKARFKKSK
tara:strand:+ start:249 stop:419 length:171 start_codon:yes stop_codon:yes gene_type:complete